MHALPPWSSAGLEYRNGLKSTVQEEDKDQSKYVGASQAVFLLGGGGGGWVINKKSTWYLPVYSS